MRKKKAYSAPKVESEQIQIGVFGNYGKVPCWKLPKNGNIRPCQ